MSAAVRRRQAVRRGVAIARLLRGTRFPDLKTQNQLDWETLRGIERTRVAQHQMSWLPGDGVKWHPLYASRRHGDS